MNKKNKVFSGLDRLPKGLASEQLTEGCVVLEGGAFRGLYTSGVLDALMEAGINLSCTVGVSAGALNGMNYVSGQIGRSGRLNLTYRHDSRYVGLKAIRKNRGVIGFDFILKNVNKEDPLNEERFFRPDRRFIVVATDCITGRPRYFEKAERETIFQAVQGLRFHALCFKNGHDQRCSLSGTVAAATRFPSAGPWIRAIKRSS